MESKRNNRSESSGNVCLTMHQPWASLLVYGIKRVEGRSWPTDHRGRLWIHAASKQPTTEEISEVEEQYRFIYNNVEGVEVEFPQSYPTSCLLGCVDVVGCASQNVIQQSPDVSEGIKMESGSEYGFLCENPQSLILPFQLSGQHKLWKLDSSSLRSAKQGIMPVQGPAPFAFPNDLRN